MTVEEAKKILVNFQRLVKQRNVYEALDVAINALAWQEAENNLYDALNPQSKENK